MELFHYKYKIIKTSWGISVGMKGYISRFSSLENDAIEITSGIWLLIESNALEEQEIKHITNGIKALANLLHANSPYGMDTLLTIKEIEYNLCDYQPEGLFCAVIGLIGNILNIELPEVKVLFDQRENLYVFDIENFECS